MKPEMRKGGEEEEEEDVGVLFQALAGLSEERL